MNFIVWDSEYGQTSRQWYCGWVLSCSIHSLRPYLSFSTTLLSSVIVTPSTTTEQDEPLVVWRVFYGFPDDLTIGISLWYHFRATTNFTVWQDNEWTLPWPPDVAVFSCLDTLMNGQRLPTRTSVIMNFIVWDALHGQVLQHKPYRKMFHCSKRSLQPHLSFSTSLLSSLTANPSMEQNINIIDNITR